MYLNYFDLKKEPFNITPDPELLFLSPSHKEALAAAIYGVTQRKGFVAIVGEVGVGKTTIVRSFLEKMTGQDLKVIYLFNADLSFHALLKTIYRELGVPPTSEDVFELVNGLHHVLIDLYRRGTNVVLIVDEAQNLPLETLKSLHMLSNLETSTVKLIQVVLSGQPELEQKLANDLLRQIRQRVVIKVRIQPLSGNDSLAYIAHRLTKTARGNPELFTAGALQVIVRGARGVPRVINTLCDNCLITAFGRQQEKVTARIAREAVFEVVGKSCLPFRWRYPLAGAAVALCIGLVFAFSQGRSGAEKHPVAAAPTAVLPEAVQPHGAKEGAVKAQLVQEPAPAVPERAQESVYPAGKGVAGAVPENGEAPVKRMVKRGDTLARLILQRYGFVNRRLITLVKRRNPQITDENLIQEGAVLYFPRIEGGS